MNRYIIQHAVSDQTQLLDLAKPINSAYAKKFGLQYKTDTKTRCADRPFYWEKIAYIQEVLSSVSDGDLVIWEDADSLNVGDQNVADALPAGGVLGMVQNRGGLNSTMLLPWYNSGIMLIVNSPTIRSFLSRAWDRGGKDDEVGIMEELKAGTDIAISPIDPKWNCWRNNETIVKTPMIKTFHGIKTGEKLKAMQAYLEAHPA